jgi:hypothetical protein
MGRMTRKLSVVALVLLGAGVAAAQSSFMNAASPSINGIAQSTTTASPTTTTPATTTNATSTSTSVADQTSVSPSGSAVAIDEIVSVARTVEAGTAPVTAFTVPAGVRLVVTDIIITNPSSAPICGAAVMPGGTAAATMTSATTPGATTVGGSTTTAATPIVESGTGVLCVPAQTSMPLGLTTGLEFSPGQGVLLSNRPLTTAVTTTAGATPTSTTASGPLLFHLRGFLMTGA